MIQTDICIVGAGPVGLFAIFEAGLLKMRCHVIDYLPKVGGQLSEIYPKKPIYDIPGYPMVLAEDLVKNLEKQIEPFSPTFTLGERVESLEKQADGSFVVTTSENTQVHAKVIAIAGGLGCFEPRKPEIADLERFEGKGINYMILDPEKYRNK
ncbi:MAG: NAD(P)/FAD-dependent oxidoreductase, partial [Verrucomicrobia bacterium]|nr:NAD(P)/FAD-dependent oxidoreductase [Cytophagales bacterium]